MIRDVCLLGGGGGGGGGEPRIIGNYLNTGVDS